MKVGVLGCMAERLKEKFLEEEEKIVDLSSWTRCLSEILPNLLKEINAGKRCGINVISI